jgi:hypothetical protein
MTNELRPAAANDNRPRMAGEFKTLADRRDWLKSLPNPPKRKLGSRIERALIDEAIEAGDPSRQAAALHHVATLQRVRELMRPADTATTVDIEGDEEDDDKNTGFGEERVHNQSAFTPSIPKLMVAYADGMRVRVVSKNGTIVGRVCTSYYRDRNGETVTIGGRLPGARGRLRFHGLRFYRGELIAFGDKGRMLRPKYVASAKGLTYDKGGVTERHVEQQRADDIAYLNLPATAPSRPAAANDNRVTYCPDAIAAGYGRLAGISESAGPGATKAPRHAGLDEMERAETFDAIGFASADLDVVEGILSGESFRAIGLQRGHAESSAHKSGRQIVERALQTISEKIAA